ncbi:MAG: serine/threonine protein kinase [Burkholderiales bacterium]|nr:serine/threonine protein kinase [Burkholderiales bacterium]
MAESTKLGKYEIRGELGRGAMGVVYEAYDPLIERAVALKTIRREALQGAHATEIIARFRREAQAAGRLTHPNIVAIYDFGEDGGVSYIAMELVKGRELKSYFEENQRFALRDVVRIVSQILAALGYSHRLGVVHRDIKPANVFIQPDGSVKVADFGIAHVESSELTQVGTVLGTPAYMSPEQILGTPVDGRSDLFSVGVMLYQFLTGERPFSGNATITMRKVLEEDPLPPSRFNTQIPGALDAVVRTALAKKPDDRFADAEAFAAALHAAAATAPVGTGSGETTVVPAPVAVGASAAAAPRAIVTPAGTPKKSQLPAVAVVGAIVVIAVAASAWMAYRSRDGATAPPVSAALTAAPVPPSTMGTPPGDAGAVNAVATGAAAPVALPPPKLDPGALVISAVGFADPADARYQSDRALLQADLRADARSQLVAKAVNLLVDQGSVAKNYDLLRDKLLTRSADYVTTVVRESAPETGKDGLASLTTEAVVNVKAVQKSLNEMSRSERIDFIRASGDPRVAVRVTTRDADQPAAPSRSSPAAENILKERIKSFGFRTWSEDGARSGDPAAGPDFIVEGEATIKRLSMKLEASGLTVTKYALNGWTVKAIDRATGEEIYYNTKLPTGQGSWASEELALQAIGTRIANEFSRDFFLSHVQPKGRRIVLKVAGLPAAVADETLRREIVGMPSVLTASMAGVHTFDLQVAGSGPAGDLVAAGILKPLATKLGQPCFSVGAVAGDEVGVTFEAKCDDPAVLARLETNPPAALYDAPTQRQKAIVKNPETLKKLMI